MKDQFLGTTPQVTVLNNFFKETTLRFCIETKNILYSSLVPFLVNEIFNRIETLEHLKALKGGSGNDDDAKGHSNNGKVIFSKEASDDSEEEDEE